MSDRQTANRDSDAQPADPKVLTPTLLNQEIRRRVVDLRDLRVRGEVTGHKTRSGHHYFTLKDAGARVNITVWRSQAERQQLRLRDGDEVICRGQVDFYVPNGRLSFVAWHVAAAGVGRLWQQFQELKDKLGKEGLFDAALKKPLPFLPGTVGVVTSPAGAGLRDILRILGDRFPVRVILAPCRVQGPTAGREIAAAIGRLDRTGLCDVIIAGRGGGSIEDLWGFNEEVVVRAVVACSTPIVSAVGHETDTLLSDYAADVRAPTPTAAAELVVPSRDELRKQIVQRKRRLWRGIQATLQGARQSVRQQRARLGSGEVLVLPARHRVDDLGHRLHAAQRRRLNALRARLSGLERRLHRNHPHARLARRKAALAVLKTRLMHAGEAAIARDRRRLDRQNTALRMLDPRAALRRGYAIVQDADTGKALRRTEDARPGQEVGIVLAVGRLAATIDGVQTEVDR